MIGRKKQEEAKTPFQCQVVITLKMELLGRMQFPAAA